MIHSRAFISRASGLCRLDVPRSSNFSDARKTCSVGRVRHVINLLPGRCHVPFTVRISKFGCHRVTRGLKLPLNAMGDEVFFAERHLRKRLHSFMWSGKRGCRGNEIGFFYSTFLFLLICGVVLGVFLRTGGRLQVLALFLFVYCVYGEAERLWVGWWL